MVDIVTIMPAMEGKTMANTVTLSIKTDPETKAVIQGAAESIGLSMNSFVLMVAKNAAESDEIIIRNSDAADRQSIGKAIEFNRAHRASTSWEDLKGEYGI
jgi:antitoxin component of RelBE/YafQ-DinJ toxin-antitoxin module